MQNVMTPKGHLLWSKGKVLELCDLEVLEALHIQHIFAEQVEAQASAEAVLPPISHDTYYQHYEQMVEQMRKTYYSASWNEIPILELRGQLKILINYISMFSPLTFIPRNMVETDYAYHSAVLSALTSSRLGQWMGISHNELMQVALAGLLHNIGNAKVDPALLLKAESLTDEEIESIRQHTTLGYNILKEIPSLNEGVKLAALQHHEKIDGSGYPFAVQGDQIHQYAKIIAVTDIFHAMTLHRVFKKGQSPYAVLEQLAEESFGKLDPECVQTFIHKVTEFQHGTKVRLSDGREGEIVFTNQQELTRPFVSVEGTIINLVNERQLIIQEVIAQK